MPPKVEDTELLDTDTETDTDDAFNDADLVDGVESAIDDQQGLTEEDDGQDEVITGVTDDDAGALGEDAAKPGKGVDRGDGRDVEGRFATKAEQDAADAAKAAGKSPAEQKAAADAAKPAAEKPPAWEPLQIKTGRALFPIEDARITKVKDAAGNSHVLISVPEKAYGQFAGRISRGIDAERQVREMGQMRRDLEFQKNAPRPKSDAEIEATMFMEALGDQVNELFTPEQLENLKLRVQIAQGAEKTNFAKAEETRRSEAESGEQWTRSQIDVLVNEAFDLVEAADAAGADEAVAVLKGMTPEQIKETLDELALPMREKLVWKENGETFVNNEYLFRLLKRARASSGAAAPAPAGQTAAPAKATTEGERFNKGQESAAAPRTTSLKERRGIPAPANRRPNREPVPSSKQRTDAQIAEDDYRKLQRKMSRSNDFEDFEGDDG